MEAEDPVSSSLSHATLTPPRQSIPFPCAPPCGFLNALLQYASLRGPHALLISSRPSLPRAVRRHVPRRYIPQAAAGLHFGVWGTSHKDLKQGGSIKNVGLPSPPSKLLPFGLSLFQGILYATLYSNHPPNHEPMGGGPRRYSHGHNTRH